MVWNQKLSYHNKKLQVISVHHIKCAFFNVFNHGLIIKIVLHVDDIAVLVFYWMMWNQKLSYHTKKLNVISVHHIQSRGERHPMPLFTLQIFARRIYVRGLLYILDSTLIGFLLALTLTADLSVQYLRKKRQCYFLGRGMCLIYEIAINFSPMELEGKKLM